MFGNDQNQEEEDEEISQQFFNDIINNQTENIKKTIQNPSCKIWTFREQDDSTPLHRAVYMNSFPLVKLLLDELQIRLGFVDRSTLTSFINMPNNQGSTPIHLACYNGNLDIVRFLIDHKANIERTNLRGLNCLHFAAQGNQPSMLVYFKEKYGMNIDLIDERGSTPLHWACYNNSKKAAEYLLSWDINVNAQDNEGLTPLYLTVRASNPAMAKLLLENGADHTIKDKSGKSSLDLANEKNVTPILTLFNRIGKQWSFSLISPIEKTRKNKAMLYYFILNITFTVLMLGSFTIQFYNNQANEWKTVVILSCIIVGMNFIHCMMYLWLSCSNPGFNDDRTEYSFIELVEKKNDDLKAMCPNCKIKKNASTKHCIICNKCVDSYIFHCFWLNNCIGKRNSCRFQAYIYYTVIVSIILIMSSIYCFVTQTQAYEDQWLNELVLMIIRRILSGIIFVFSMTIFIIFIGLSAKIIQKFCCKGDIYINGSFIILKTMNFNENEQSKQERESHISLIPAHERESYDKYGLDTNQNIFDN